MIEWDDEPYSAMMLCRDGNWCVRETWHVSFDPDGLDDFIEKLIEIRGKLPEGARAKAYGDYSCGGWVDYEIFRLATDKEIADHIEPWAEKIAKAMNDVQNN